MTKKMIWVQTNHGMSLDFDYASIPDAIQELQRCQDQYGAEFTKLELRLEQNCRCWGDCGCSDRVYLYGLREETDVEYAVRLESEERYKRTQEERERKEFQRLAAKFAAK